MTERLYHNISLAAPDGEILSYVPSKRADWYVRKGLAEWAGERQIRIKFEPASRSKISDWYLVEHKNQCVVCGEKDANLLQKHHVVPACLRKWMKEGLKSHRSFDVLMVCETCHRDYETEAEIFRRQLAAEVGMDAIGKGAQWQILNEKEQGIRYARSLIDHKVPETAAEKMQKQIIELLGVLPEDEAQVAAIQNELRKQRRALADQWFRALVEKHVPSEDLIVRWRRHFVEAMNPRFLEPEWVADIAVVG